MTLFSSRLSQLWTRKSPFVEFARCAELAGFTGFTKFVGLALICCLGSLWGTHLHALTCKDIGKLTTLFLKQHYYFSNFDDEISQRTLKNLIEFHDPGKVFFLESDIKRFEKSYKTELDDAVARNDCTPMDDVSKTFQRRFDERQSQIQALLERNYDFTIDEYMPIDRKNMAWAKTTDELDERWRMRIKFQYLQLKSSLGDMKEARKKLTKRYELLVKNQKEQSRKQEISLFINAFSSSLDRHSTYYTPQEREEFDIATRLSLDGIGAILRSEDGFTSVVSVVVGGAAHKEGTLKAEDKIIGVAQEGEEPVDVIDMKLQDVVRMIRGKRGTTVTLSVLREEKNKTQKLKIAIVREKIEIKDKSAKGRVFRVSDKPRSTESNGSDDAKTTQDSNPPMKIGVIDLPSFYIDFQARQARQRDFKSSSRDLLVELEKLKNNNDFGKKGIDALIIDLRNNSGGSLDESINISGFFIDKGPVVMVKGLGPRITTLADEDPRVAYDGPLVVMINKQSASASEIFAGAIKDHGRGILVGDSHTFGKGTVQTMNTVSKRLGAIKVTTSKFYTPGGSSTQLKGVEADITLPSIASELEIGEKYGEFALPWEKIRSARFDYLGRVKPHLAKVRERSEQRTLTDEDYQELVKEIQKYKENEADRKRVSLKEEAEEDSKDKDNDTQKSKDNKAEATSPTTKLPESEDSLKTKVAEKEEKADKAPNPHGGSADDKDSFRLDEDIHLQEALRIATDYTFLLNRKPLPKRLELPDLKPIDKESEAEANKGDTPKKDADRKEPKSSAK